MKNLFIYSLNIYEHDAVGKHCILLSKLSERIGWDAKLFAVGHSPNILDVSEIEKHAVSDAVLFFSYSIYDKNLDYLLGLNFKYKICYFHGVTPLSSLQHLNQNVQINVRWHICSIKN